MQCPPFFSHDHSSGEPLEPEPEPPRLLALMEVLERIHLDHFTAGPPLVLSSLDSHAHPAQSLLEKGSSIKLGLEHDLAHSRLLRQPTDMSSARAACSHTRGPDRP